MRRTEFGSPADPRRTHIRSDYLCGETVPRHVRAYPARQAGLADVVADENGRPCRPPALLTFRFLIVRRRQGSRIDDRGLRREGAGRTLWP